jgi:hypothetical protein
MAKNKAAKPEKSKAQAIRDALGAYPDDAPKDIAARLTDEGYTVKPQEVSNLKSAMKRAEAAGKPAAAKPAAAIPAASKPAARATDLVSLAALKRVQALAAELGGISEAKKALESLEQLMK